MFIFLCSYDAMTKLVRKTNVAESNSFARLSSFLCPHKDASWLVYVHNTNPLLYTVYDSALRKTCAKKNWSRCRKANPCVRIVVVILARMVVVVAKWLMRLTWNQISSEAQVRALSTTSFFFFFSFFPCSSGSIFANHCACVVEASTPRFNSSLSYSSLLSPLLPLIQLYNYNQERVIVNFYFTCAISFVSCTITLSRGHAISSTHCDHVAFRPLLHLSSHLSLLLANANTFLSEYEWLQLALHLSRPSF